MTCNVQCYAPRIGVGPLPSLRNETQELGLSLNELRHEDFEHCTCLGYPRPLRSLYPEPEVEVEAEVKVAEAVAVVAPAVPPVAALVGRPPPRAREAQP